MSFVNATAGKFCLTAIILAALTACVPQKNLADDPSSIVFSETDEAESDRRFNLMMQSFSQGDLTAIYDPRAAVPGQPDRSSPLKIADHPTLPEESLQQADRWTGERNSSALIVFRNGAIELESYYGGAEATSLLNSKSFAKPLTAIAVGRAIALGKIQSLDQPVADFVPQWRSDAQRSQIKVRYLLEMRAGFMPTSASADAAHILNRSYVHPRHDEVIIREYPLTSEPGTRYDYSNVTAEMVAPLIEAATGLKYETFISREILQPIGAAGGEIWVNRAGGTAHSGCCIMLPARDWLRLSVLLLQDGMWDGKRLLPDGYVRQMRTGTPQNPRYGLGLWLQGEYVAERPIANPDLNRGTIWHSEPFIAPDLFQFDGNGNQVSYVIPSQGMVILRMGNSPPPELRWDNAYLPNLLVKASLQGGS